MPALPAEPGARRRRNLNQNQWRGLPAEGRKGRAPACPPKWKKATKDWWKIIWRSPMATVWLESDIPALTMLGDLRNMAEPTAAILAEIRQIEDRFGLSPKSRRMLQWQIESDADTRANLEELTAPLAANVRRLRAVDAQAG